MSSATMLQAALTARRGERRNGGAPRLEVAGALALAALGHDRARATIGGWRPQLSIRHSEILVLLAASPQGLTADQLAIALYGDAGKPVTARAEIFRLRKILGAGIGTEPYRLDMPVQADFIEVQDLLRAGHVSDALRRYGGPLLPRSEAPGVVELRQELDGWMRRSALTSDDPEALWGWLSSASGREDLQAWKRFLANVSPQDGRRGLAAARLERLRELLAPPSIAA
jgi:hypothetical protein